LLRNIFSFDECYNTQVPPPPPPRPQMATSGKLLERLLEREIMKTRMFVVLDKAKPDTENIRGLNVTTAKHTTVQVTRLPL
jgi:hypothetical protein